MPTINREATAPLMETLTLTLAKSEVQAKFKSELARFKAKASIKGFRQGKAPDSFVQKMYGQDILVDIVNNMMQNEVNAHLKEANLDLLGQPIPSEDTPSLSFNASAIPDFVFKFDIGLSPTFDINGLTHDTKITKYSPQITDEMIDEQLEAIVQRTAKTELVEGAIKKGDRLLLTATEVDGSLEKEFSMLVNDMTNEARAEFLNMKSGESIIWNVFELEVDRDAEFVKKYMLGIENDQTVGTQFNLTIKEINRQEVAVANEEAFATAFGPEVKTVEEAKTYIVDDFKKFYSPHAIALTYRDLQEIVIEQNKMPLPDEFLKRWLKVSNDKNTDEVIAKDYERFASNMRWTLIRDKVIQDNELTLTQGEMLDGYKAKISKMYGGAGFDDGIITSIAQNFLNDKKYQAQTQEMAEELMFDKVFADMLSKVSVTEQPVSMDEFLEMNQKAQDQAREMREGSLMENMEEAFEEE